MATYRIYPDRNAWANGNTGESFEQDSLEAAKLQAVGLGWTHVESVDTGATVYRVAGVWRKA